MVKVEDVVENLTGYVESRIEVIKLDVKNEVTRISVATVVWMIVSIFALMVLVCLSIALGLWLGDLTGSQPLGFVLVALVYVVVSAGLLASQESLQKVVARRVFPNHKH